MTATAPPNRSARHSRRALLGVSFSLTLTLSALAACGDSADQAAPAAAPGRGGELYAANCASCHGSDLRGTGRGPSQLSIVYEPNHHGDDSYRSAIAQGVRAHHWNFGDMPAIGGLEDDEVDAIIAFIRSEQEREGFEPYERP
jgi:mono/diheme cytochrome c family protein